MFTIADANNDNDPVPVSTPQLGVLAWHTGDFELDRLYANYAACPR
jgi:hypothetical protein